LVASEPKLWRNRHSKFKYRTASFFRQYCIESSAPGSFIFSIGNSVVDTFVSRLKDENHWGAIRDSRGCGPYFGCGDLFISHECKQNTRSGCKSEVYDRQLMDEMERGEYGWVWFKVEEYEVHGVK